MPVTSTLGALTYAKTVTAGITPNYDYYCLQIQSPYTLNGFAYDPVANAYYLGGYDSSNFLTSKFTENPKFPLQTYTVSHNIATSSGISGGKVDYNSNTGNVVLVGNYTSNAIPIGTLLSVSSSTGLKVNTNANATESGVRFFNCQINTGGNVYITGTFTSTSIPNQNFMVGRKWNRTSYTTTPPTLTNFFTRRGASTIQITGKDVAIDSTGNGYFIGTELLTPNRTIVLKTDSSLNVTLVKDAWTLIPGENFIPEQIRIDSADNVHYISNVGTNAGFVVKWDNAMTTTLWSKRIAGVTLKSIFVDNSSNVYVAGTSVTTNRLYIAKFNSAGILQFEREVFNTSAAPFTNVSEIYANSTAMYITGNINNANAFVLKLPNDGTIPGTGVYAFIGGSVSSLNYISTTKVITNFGISPLTTSAPTTGGSSGVITGDVTDTVTPSTTYIANI